MVPHNIILSQYMPHHDHVTLYEDPFTPCTKVPVRQLISCPNLTWISSFLPALPVSPTKRLLVIQNCRLSCLIEYVLCVPDFRCLITILSTIPYALGSWSWPRYLSQPGTYSLCVRRSLQGTQINVLEQRLNFMCLIEILHHWPKFSSAWLIFWGFDPCDTH